MKLEELKVLLGDKYKFTAEHDPQALKKSIDEQTEEFAGEVPYVLEAGCVDIEVEVVGDVDKIYSDYYTCVKIDDDTWRTFEFLPEEVNFDVPDMAAEMFRLLDEYVQKFGLSYTEHNGQQFDEMMSRFGKPSKHTPPPDQLQGMNM